MRRFSTRLLKLERDQPAPPGRERERIGAIGRALKALWRMGFVWASEAMAAGVPVTDDQKAIERWHIAFTLASTPPGLEQNDRWRRELTCKIRRWPASGVSGRSRAGRRGRGIRE
jgi:hypothetical protein